MVAIIIVAVALLAVVLMLLFSDQAQKRRQEKRDWKRDHFQFEVLCRSVREVINEVLLKDYKELNLNMEETQKRINMQARLKKATRQACLGDAGDRDFLKDHIKDVLTSRLGVDEVTINQIIQFNNTAKMSAVEKFEYLYTLYKKKYTFNVLRTMIKDFHWDRPKPTSDGRYIYCIDEDDIEEAFATCHLVGDYNDKLDTVVQRVFETLYGNSVADIPIMDESLDGVSGGVGGRTRLQYSYLRELENAINSGESVSNQYDTIYCVYHGITIRLKFMSFGNMDTLISVVKRIYQYEVKVALSKKNPVLHGTMKSNYRIVVGRPPVADGWGFFVRKFESADAKHIESLVTHMGRGIVISLLRAITMGELNFVVSGNMGSGKTTMLKSLVGFFNPQYTIRSAETSFELNLNNLYPDRNIFPMQERGDSTIYDIITYTKKMDTDVMIVGEVNEPKIAGAFIQVAQSGSRMAVTTLHHKTTDALIEYFRNALVEEFGINDVNIAEKQIVDILNFDVHTAKDLDGNFFIARITEVIPVGNKPYPSRADDARIEYYKRSTDRHFYDLNDIIVFDHDNMRYVVKNNISDYTYGLIVEKAGSALADSIRSQLASAMKGYSFDNDFKSAEDSQREDSTDSDGDVDGFFDEYADPYANAGGNFEPYDQQQEFNGEPLDDNEEAFMDFELNNGYATREDYGLPDNNGDNK